MAASDDTFVMLDRASDKGRKQGEIEMADLGEAGSEVMKDAIGGLDHWQLPAGCGRRCRLIAEFVHGRCQAGNPF